MMFVAVVIVAERRFQHGNQRIALSRQAQDLVVAPG